MVTKKLPEFNSMFEVTSTTENNVLKVKHGGGSIMIHSCMSSIDFFKMAA